MYVKISHKVYSVKYVQINTMAHLLGVFFIALKRSFSRLFLKVVKLGYIMIIGSSAALNFYCTLMRNIKALTKSYDQPKI